MQHRIFSVGLLLISALVMSACAGTSATNSPVRTPVSLALEADNTEVWQNAALQIKSRVPVYDIAVSGRSDEKSYLDRIFQTDTGNWGVCLSPKAEFDFAGSLMGVTPLYCGAIDESSPDKSLQAIVETYQANHIRPESNESIVDYRQRILKESTPENPVCFSVFPVLFSTGDKISEILMENYLIACSRRIDGHTSKYLPDGILSAWMLAQAALITEKNSLISRAFNQLMKFRSRETSIYGISLEAYIEFLSRKQFQAEISSIQAVKKSDEAGYYLLSHENVQILALLAQTSETMDGERLEKAARSLSPREGLPARLVEERQLLHLKTCRLAAVIPEVTSGTVSACLPWLRTSIQDEDSYAMALLLVEHGIYGTKSGSPAIAEDVLDWLQRAPLSESLKALRHEFGQRFSVNERLSEHTRQVLSTF